MILREHSGHRTLIGFPRVSGDEPKRQAEPAETGTLSLREWG